MTDYEKHTYKYHIIYKTTNKVNKRFYIGMHSTNNLKDDYLGSGFALKDALKKYGRANFTKEILFVFSTREEARAKEAELVNEDFLKNPLVYNLVEGGMARMSEQFGEKNPMWGKPSIGRKPVKATHKDGRVLYFESIRACADGIGIDRANVRNLIKKGIQGKRGWRVVKI